MYTLSKVFKLSYRV